MLENRKVILKQINLFSALAFIPYFIQWMIMGEWMLFNVGFISLLPLLANVWLIRKNRLATASLLTLLFAIVNVYMYDDGLGGQTGYYYYLVSTTLCAFVLFKRAEYYYRLVAIVFSGLAVLLTNIPGASPRLYEHIAGLDVSAYHLYSINFVVASGCTMAVVYSMVAAYRRTELRLKEALQKAEELAELKTQFLSNMSHELRTPMNAVIGLTDVLMREQPRPDQLEHLQVMKFSSNNLLYIINDILDYSRIESGKIDLEKSDFSLTNMLRYLKSSMKHLAEKNNVEVHLDIDPRIPERINGDENRLIQVMNNLLNNAIKFTNEGSVHIAVRLRELDAHHCRLHFSVRDSGIGIPADKHQLIFERFTQASPETTRKYGGTGLGLAICSRLLALQGSTIHLESSPGKGAEFSFELSFAMAEMTAVSEEKTELALELLRNARVLLAEDNAINQLVARQFLEEWGVDLKVVNNGKEALEHVRDNQVDLVLMDLQMPEMDGFEASRSIRSLQGEQFSRLPIIALTASATHEVGEMHTRCGMNDFIHKPFNPEELFRKMAFHLA